MSLDAKVLVIARHAPDGHRKAAHLLCVEVVVAARFLLTHTQGVADQVSGDQYEVRTICVSDRPELLQAGDGLPADVRVGRVHERERRRSLLWRQWEICRAGNYPPEVSDWHVAIRHADEHESIRPARKRVAAVGGGLDDLPLIRHCHATKRALARISLPIAVRVLEDDA